MNLINSLQSKLKNSENWLWKALWQNVVSPFANQIHLWLPRCWNIYLKTLQIWSVLLALGGNDLYWGPDILSDITWDVIDLLCIFRKVENMIYNLLSGFWSHGSYAEAFRSDLMIARASNLNWSRLMPWLPPKLFLLLRFRGLTTGEKQSPEPTKKFSVIDP